MKFYHSFRAVSEQFSEQFPIRKSVWQKKNCFRAVLEQFSEQFSEQVSIRQSVWQKKLFQSSFRAVF